MDYEQLKVTTGDPINSGTYSFPEPLSTEEPMRVSGSVGALMYLKYALQRDRDVMLKSGVEVPVSLQDNEHWITKVEEAIKDQQFENQKVY